MNLQLPIPHDAVSEAIAEAFVVKFKIPEDYPYCEGHFPGDPIVPGVTQIGWVLRALGAALDRSVEQYRLSRVKFTRPIRPLESVCLQLSRGDKRCSFQISVGQDLCSSGIVHFDDHV